YPNVAVLFADLVGFTAYCDERDPDEVVAVLQQLFEGYEQLLLDHGLEKIKSIGDAIMATAGLLRRNDNPALDCIRCGLAMRDAARALPVPWEVRVGIHVGPVVAGLVGKRQYAFDLWGDTVNTASRVETHAAPGDINLSAAAWHQVADRCRGDSL